MGLFRTCAFCVAALVAIVAVSLGALFGGHLNALAPLVHSISPGGSQKLIGMVPSFLGADPWPFEYAELPDLTGKVALITGANSGIGYWTALHLARKGATVHLGCRSADKCDKAIASIKANTSVAKLAPAIGDMSKLKSVRDLGTSFLKSQERLDIFVMNAGVASSGDKVTEDNIEPVFATNHVGHQLLYTLLEDLLVKTSEKQGDVRVVVVSSAGHFDSYEDGIALTRQELNARHSPVVDQGAITQTYEQSKLANVLFAQEAASRMRRKDVYVNSVHPGFVGSEFINNYKSVAPEKFQDAHKMLFSVVQYLASRAAWSPEEGALTQVYLAAADDVRERDLRGRYFHPQATEVVPRRLHCANVTLQKALWKFTEALIAGKDQ